VDPLTPPTVEGYEQDVAPGRFETSPTGESKTIATAGSGRTRPTNYAEAPPPFAPPAESSEPRERARSFQDFADEFSERLEAAASELGLLQER
jgi:hypothetical protein